jgi:uncharacterized membrane protein YqjE
MEASASHFAAFVSDVLLYWGTAITLVAFGLVSLNSAVLTVQWPVESRLKWLFRIAVAYIFVACFLAGASIYQK